MTCHLSSLYNDSKGSSAGNAVDGNIDGNDISSLAHTQFEANPYFEVDLGSVEHITNSLVEPYKRIGRFGLAV